MRDLDAIIEAVRPELEVLEKARQELDWSPQYDIKDGLAMTYKWWVEQGLDKEPWDFSPEDRLLAAFTSSA